MHTLQKVTFSARSHDMSEIWQYNDEHNICTCLTRIDDDVVNFSIYFKDAESALHYALIHPVSKLNE